MSDGWILPGRLLKQAPEDRRAQEMGPVRAGLLELLERRDPETQRSAARAMGLAENEVEKVREAANQRQWMARAALGSGYGIESVRHTFDGQPPVHMPDVGFERGLGGIGLRRWQARPSFDERRLDRERTWTLAPDERLFPALSFTGNAPTDRWDDDHVLRPQVTTLVQSATDGTPPRVLQGDPWATMRRVISLDKLEFGGQVMLGGSTATSSQLAGTSTVSGLQRGEHDPKKKGYVQSNATIAAGTQLFRFINADLLFGFQDDGVTKGSQIEEGEFWSEILEDRLAVSVAKFSTPFGIENLRPSYDHWWVDQPLCVTRLLGENGLRPDLGSQIAWQQARTGTRLHVGSQNADKDDTEVFLAKNDTLHLVGGRPKIADRDGFYERLFYFARAQQRLSRCDAETTWTAGASFATGPNATGNTANTSLYGLDLNVTHEGRCGRPWMWQTEAIWRSYEADPIFHSVTGAQLVPASTLDDWGVYSEALYGLSPSFALGARVDYVTGSGDSVTSPAANTFLTLARNADTTRDDRLRLSALFMWQPLPKLRLRVEYSYDDAQSIGHPVHSVWIAFDGNWGFEAWSGDGLLR